MIYNKTDIPADLHQYFVRAEIGLEETPEAFIAKLVEVFREVRRVLREDGTCWVNMGDSYASTPPGNTTKGVSAKSGLNGINGASGKYRETLDAGHATKRDTSRLPGIKPKDLIGVPWMLAFALRADGWYLRQDIIWAKPNPMPESVRDRCTKAHEYIFLLAKSERYYFDQDAILEPVSAGTHARLSQNVQAQIGSARANGGAKTNGNMKAVGRKLADEGQGTKNNGSFDAAMAIMPSERNKRSVWTVPTESYSGAHFATFPQRLIEPCILAGAPAGGVVLDPFGGSGTTGSVAQRLGRKWIMCELNPAYKELQDERLTGTLGLEFA